MVVVIPPMRSSTTEQDGSFVKIPSNLLAAKAKASLAEITRRKDRAVKRLIEKRKQEIYKAREAKKNSWWSRVFGYKEEPMPTDEDILADIQAGVRGDCISLPETFWITLQYDKYEEVAYRLLNACEHSDEVFVSTKDLERLL